MKLEEYELLVRRALENGVPHNIVAVIFELDPAVTKDLQKEVQVAEYGTEDQDEYLAHLQWKFLKHTGETIDTGSPAEVARLTSAVLGRQIAAAGKRPSSGTTEAREQLMAMLGGMRTGSVATLPAPGQFVVGGGARADDDGDDAEP